MTKIILTTESGSDILGDLAKNHGVYVVPMHIVMDGVDYLDGELPVPEIFEYYEETKKNPLTTSTNPHEYTDFFTHIRSEFPDSTIIHVGYTSKASSSLYLLPFIVIILGLMGLGPLTVMVLVAGILTTLDLPYPPELIVLAITSGSVISILLSPLILPLIVLSNANGLSSLKNGIKNNWKFALVFYGLTQTYIQIMIYLWT